MNALKVSAISLALVGSAVALAQEGTQDFVNLPKSTLTRAEVKADLAAAQASGRLDNRGEAYGGFDSRKFESTRSRAQVLAELDAARRAGELETHNYAYGSFAPKDITSSRSRAEVKAELAQALAKGPHLSRGERS